MKALQHKKFKNTGLLFELLVRQIASDTLNGVDSKALPLIKKYFAKSTELSKELSLYQNLMKEKVSKEAKANYLIDAVVEARSKLNESSLNKQKYNLIKDIKECYTLESFFQSKVSDYKTLAAIYKLFEYTVADSPIEITNNRYTLIEHLTRTKVKSTNELNEVTEFIKQDKDIRLLTYKILVDKFNEKYSDLNEGQKKILRTYINSITEGTELKTFINEEVNSIQLNLKKLAPKVSDKVIKIKLKEVTVLLKEISDCKTVKDHHILNLLRYHELIKELKKV
jgi:hypothetical protein